MAKLVYVWSRRKCMETEAKNTSATDWPSLIMLLVTSLRCSLKTLKIGTIHLFKNSSLKASITEKRGLPTVWSMVRSLTRMHWKANLSRFQQSPQKYANQIGSCWQFFYIWKWMRKNRHKSTSKPDKEIVSKSTKTLRMQQQWLAKKNRPHVRSVDVETCQKYFHYFFFDTSAKNLADRK